MGDLLRRRALMVPASSGGGTDLLYSLYNFVLAGGEQINTGVSVLADGVSSTILLDITTTADPTDNGATASVAKYILVFGANGYRGLCIGKHGRTNSNLSAWWMSTSNTDRTTLTFPGASGRKRMLVTHTADSDVLYVYTKYGTNVRQTNMLTKTFTAAPSERVHFGGSTTQALPSGTIQKAEIYNRVLNAEEIDAFFAD